MATDNNKLLKVLGLGFGVAVTIGGTIGTGILRKPGTIAEAIGSPMIIISLWLAVGLYAIGGVLCASELGVSIPRAGAWYVYAERAFGPYFGFVTGITSWFGTVAALGFGAYTWSEYIAILSPSMGGYLEYVSIAILTLLLLFHLIGTNIGGKSQEVLAIIKAVGLLIFVVICFILGGRNMDSIASVDTSSMSNSLTLMGIITALQGIFYTFDGWHTAAYFTEENKDPTKNLAKSMMLGVLAIIGIYILVNLAIFYVVPMDELVGSKLAAALAVEKLFGTGASNVVTFFLMISILGILNAQVMFAPRVIYSMAHDGLFPKSAVTVNKSGSPSIGLVITVGLSILLILSGKEICGKLSDIATFFFVMSYAAGFASLIKLRMSEPDLERPYKVPFYPALPALLLVVSLLFLIGAVYQDLESSKYAIIFLAMSYPLYVLTRMVMKLKV